MPAITNATLKSYLTRLKKCREGFTPNEAQKQALDAVYVKRRTRVCLCFGRRTGKTEIFSRIIGERTATLPNQVGYIIGPTRKQELEILWHNGRLRQTIPKSFKPTILETQSRIIIPFEAGDSFIKVDGSEEYESFRGTRFHSLGYDEGQACDWRFFEAAYPSLLDYGGLLMVSGTIDSSPTNEFNIRVQEWMNDPEWEVIFAPTSVNAHNLNQGKGLDWLKREKEKYYARGDGPLWEREYEARFVFGGKRSVFPMYGNMRVRLPLDIIQQRFNSGTEFVTIFDPSQSCFGVLVLAIDRHTSFVYVLGEIYEQNRANTSVSQIWSRTRDLEARVGAKDPLRVYDEAAAWFQNEMAVQYGVGVVQSQKGSTSKEDNISLVKDILLEKKLVVCDECPNFEREMTAYEYDDNSKIIKKNDHLVDGLFYGLSVWGYRANPDPINVATNSHRKDDLADSLDSVEVDNSMIEVFDDDSGFYDIGF